MMMKRTIGRFDSPLPYRHHQSHQIPSSAHAPGTYSFHLTVTRICDTDSSNPFARLTLLTNSKATIGNTTVDPIKKPNGDPINTSNPLSFNYKLPNPLVITDEYQNDYMQFTDGTLLRTSRTSSSAALYSKGGWDARDGSVCATSFGDQIAVDSMDFSLPF